MSLSRKFFNEIPQLREVDVFGLYDTYGFPFDLTALLAKERGFEINELAFQRLMKDQQDRSRKSSKYEWVAGPAVSLWLKDGEDIKIKAAVENKLKNASFEYEGFEVDAQILSSPLTYTLGDENKFKRFISGLVLDKTTFYAESGGQVSDTGALLFDLVDSKLALPVLSLDKQYGKIVHVIDDRNIDINEIIRKCVSVQTRIDVDRRLSIMRNHTATHLVHEALRRVLGEHLHQHGSLVDDKHLRFDFNHFDKVSPEQLQAIEEMVNAKISEAIQVQALNDPKGWVSIEEAKKRWSNVKMFFGDKYGDKVRVVEIDPKFSVELCGGTHVKSTNEIGYFKFRTEGSVASGVRRIEAVTHDFAFELLKLQEKSL
ncbi:MAG: hypothetical protein HYY49_00820, partial [Ignavibacteriales bacterium]|nr:hypothetical protein [Ignavibacteriales bacterium]